MQVAQDRLNSLRRDKLNWRGDVIEGLDSFTERDRAMARLERERKFRMRSRQRELREAGMGQLFAATVAAYQQDLETLEDHPLVKAMLNDHGRLISRTAAEVKGKLKTDGNSNAGDWEHRLILQLPETIQIPLHR